MMCKARKSPTFKGLQASSELAARTKSANRRQDTVPEVLLRRALWQRGLRYRKNVTALPGKPDVVFRSAKVAVFCDGDFWHGRNWPTLKSKLEKGSNAPYWIEKIRTNIERDSRHTAKLEEDGWTVIRLWETDIKRDPGKAAEAIEQVVRNESSNETGNASGTEGVR